VLDCWSGLELAEGRDVGAGVGTRAGDGDGSGTGADGLGVAAGDDCATHLLNVACCCVFVTMRSPSATVAWCDDSTSVIKEAWSGDAESNASAQQTAKFLSMTLNCSR
jgi:hypothetical protein